MDISVGVIKVGDYDQGQRVMKEREKICERTKKWMSWMKEKKKRRSKESLGVGLCVIYGHYFLNSRLGKRKKQSANIEFLRNVLY